MDSQKYYSKYIAKNTQRIIIISNGMTARKQKKQTKKHVMKNETNELLDK